MQHTLKITHRSCGRLLPDTHYKIPTGRAAGCCATHTLVPTDHAAGYCPTHIKYHPPVMRQVVPHTITPTNHAAGCCPIHISTHQSCGRLLSDTHISTHRSCGRLLCNTHTSVPTGHAAGCPTH